MTPQFILGSSIEWNSSNKLVILKINPRLMGIMSLYYRMFLAMGLLYE